MTAPAASPPPAGDPWRSRAVNLACLLLPGLLALSLDALVLRAPLLHAGLLALLPAAAGAIAWSLAPRWEMILAASLATCLWATLYRVPAPHLAATLALGGLFLIPAGLLERWPRAVPAILAGLLAGGAAYLATGLPAAALLAGAVALVAAWARPLSPTHETLSAVRTGALYGPGLVLLALVAVNAATGRMDTMTVPAALGFGLGLMALFTLLAVVGLGLATLLGSQAPQQAAAWTGLAVTAGVVSGTMVTRDPSGILEAAAFGALVIFPLATILPAQVTSRTTSEPTSRGRVRWAAMLFALPSILAAVAWLA